MPVPVPCNGVGEAGDGDSSLVSDEDPSEVEPVPVGITLSETDVGRIPVPVPCNPGVGEARNGDSLSGSDVALSEEPVPSGAESEADEGKIPAPVPGNKDVGDASDGDSSTSSDSDGSSDEEPVPAGVEESDVSVGRTPVPEPGSDDGESPSENESPLDEPEAADSVARDGLEGEVLELTKDDRIVDRPTRRPVLLEMSEESLGTGGKIVGDVDVGKMILVGREPVLPRLSPTLGDTTTAGDAPVGGTRIVSALLVVGGITVSGGEPVDPGVVIGVSRAAEPVVAASGDLAVVATEASEVELGCTMEAGKPPVEPGDGTRGSGCGGLAGPTLDEAGGGVREGVVYVVLGRVAEELLPLADGELNGVLGGIITDVLDGGLGGVIGVVRVAELDAAVDIGIEIEMGGESLSDGLLTDEGEVDIHVDGSLPAKSGDARFCAVVDVELGAGGGLGNIPSAVVLVTSGSDNVGRPRPRSAGVEDELDVRVSVLLLNCRLTYFGK